MSATLNIKDLENLSGIKAHTLRIWEKRYNLFSPQRSATNIRSYSNEDLHKLLSVVVMLDSGKRISQICSMSPEKIGEEITEISNRTEYKEQSAINELLYASLNYDVASFESIVDKKIGEEGLETVVEKCFYPLLKKIGMLWTAKKMSPAQEHFASQLIRKTLFTEIGNLPSPTKTDKSFCLFLPEKELHEIGLLYAHYLILKAGYKSMYLGPNLPIQSFKECLETSKFTHVFTILTLNNTEANRNAKVEELFNCISSEHLLIGSSNKLICEESKVKVSHLKEISDIFKHL